jgi:hypothetical protein
MANQAASLSLAIQYFRHKASIVWADVETSLKYIRHILFDIEVSRCYPLIRLSTG